MMATFGALFRLRQDAVYAGSQRSHEGTLKLKSVSARVRISVPRLWRLFRRDGFAISGTARGSNIGRP
jgi:hypothetical protein